MPNGSSQQLFEITINDKKLQAQPGETIIQVADKNGIKIPRFCYHPHLKVVAQCRMCLVEVRGAPKPLAACSTPIADKMVVQTASPQAKAAQTSVLEFLLINHPLDCPICDKGGECPLQNNAFQYGSSVSRMDDMKRRLDKNKDFGKHIVFDTERCILCSRCERFCKDVTGTSEIGITHRGAHSEIDVFTPEGVDNEYSLNIVDLCPVGALTDKDFRFRARPWEMKATTSFCPSCTLGCDAQFWVKTSFKKQEMLRMNAPGDAENWLCDYGRLNYKVFNNQEKHLKNPQVRKNGRLTEVSWDEALEVVKNLLEQDREAHFAISGNITSEAADFLLSLGPVPAEAGRRGLKVRVSEPILAAWKTLLDKKLLERGKFSKVFELGRSVRESYPVLYLDLREAQVQFEKIQSLKEMPVEDGVALAIDEKHMNTEEFVQFVEKINNKMVIIPLFSSSNAFGLLQRGLVPWQLTGFDDVKSKTVYFIGRTLKTDFDYSSVAAKLQGKKIILQDTIESLLCDLAEVILPMQDLSESGGHFRTYYSFLNGEVEREFLPCMNPQGSSKSDWEIISLLSS
ncbi:MAG TPA: 2Fe-2S iron-sulfur cluster-binding protein [Bdellovibrionota bacterium]|nr:2Fe-2S iron-sulfur cluster-binding protein [Bdellovibrionota bacterium]